MNINGCWEDRPSGQFICRWMVVWEEIDSTKVVGVVAGYSGGGSFELERFRGILSNNEFNTLWIDCSDKISGKEIDFTDLRTEELLIFENALDEIWNLNDYDIWCETDNIVLSNNKKCSFQPQDKLLFLGEESRPWINQLCNLCGLTAGPN